MKIFESYSPLDEVNSPAFLSPPSYWQEKWQKIKRNRSFLASCGVLLSLIGFAIIGPYLTLYPYDEMNLAFKNLPPSTKFWFGTDELGRDLFTRCCWGARVSILVGFAASLIDVFIGVSYGMIAGVAKRSISEWMMRFIDVVQSIPYLLIVILLVVVMGPGLLTIIVALALTGWINMARIVRVQVLQLKNQEFILAAQGYGASKLRILNRYILPHISGTVLMILTASLPTALFTEAFLSFLGLGVQAPVASWGTLANDGLLALRYYPWRLFFPASLIFLSIFCLNIIGDGLRDVFDEKVKR